MKFLTIIIIVFLFTILLMGLFFWFDYVIIQTTSYESMGGDFIDTT